MLLNERIRQPKTKILNNTAQSISANVLVLGHRSRKIRYFWVVPKFAHPVAHFQASILQAKAGRRRWLPVGAGRRKR